jgi:prephenate dehydrogenase
MNICVVGLGLIGGSFALGLKAKDSSVKIIGVDNVQKNAEKALELGIADEISTLDVAVSKSDVTVLAIPVDKIENIIPHLLDILPFRAVLTDLGSTKELICKAAQSHSKRGRFVAAHPISGTEWSGPEAAFKDLMPGKQMILCDVEKSDADALSVIEDIFRHKIGMKINYMNSVEHDRHIAYVSHLSHISSFALGVTVLEKEKDEESIFKMAGRGFSSTVRLAKSSPHTWAPIFLHNRTNVSKALGAYIDQLNLFKQLLDAQDEEGCNHLMEKANEIVRPLHEIDRKQ